MPPLPQLHRLRSPSELGTAYAKLSASSNALWQRFENLSAKLLSQQALGWDEKYWQGRIQQEREAYEALCQNIRARLSLLWEDHLGNALAKLVDERPQPQAEGYVAERHPLVPGTILVWAPCSCVYVADKMESFVTYCHKDDCVFQWAEVELALQALHDAETPTATTLEVKNGPADIPAPAVPDSGAEAGLGTTAQQPAEEAQAQEMISEGGPSSPETPDA